MALKGNLLFNGDFETGTTEGWETEPFGLTQQYTFECASEAKYRGDYGGKLNSGVDYAQGYIAYNKICSFEEYEAYLAILYVKKIFGDVNMGIVYGMDDKGNLIDKYVLGYNTDDLWWRKFIYILRGFGDITHFKIGHYVLGKVGGGLFYVDEAKLIPLRSVKGHELAEYRYYDNLSYSKTWYSGLACIGRCKLRSIVRVEDVHGTSPTLDIKVKCFLLEYLSSGYTLTHTQFTSEGFEEVTIDLPEVSNIKIEYSLGGTDPRFDIHHHLRIEPY